MRRGGGGAGGQLPPPNSGKQWVKFGQTVGEIRAKQEEKIGQRKLQINPFGMWMMTSHRQCPRGGGGACECPRVGFFSNFGRADDVTRAMSKGGGGACGYLCKISGKSTPLPSLTKAFPYAYEHRCRKRGGRGSDPPPPLWRVGRFSPWGSPHSALLWTSPSRRLYFILWLQISPPPPAHFKIASYAYV